MALRNVFACLVLLAAVPTPADAAKPRLRVIERAAPAPMLANGGSFSARDVGSSVVVTDETRHREVTVPKPAPCQQPYITTELVAVGGVTGLFDSCRLSESQPTVFDLRTGAITSLPRLAHVPDASAFASAVGNRWIEVVVRHRHSSDVKYLDWHTGEERYDDGRASVALDLNNPPLLQPLCSPLARQAYPLDPDYERSGWAPYSYAGGVGVTAVPRGKGHRSRLTLQRCGSRELTVLDRDCGWLDCQAQLGGGVVSWLRERPGDLPNRKSRVSAHAFVLRTRQTLSWKLPAGAVAQVAHTRRALYVSVSNRPQSPTWRLLRARVAR